MNQRAVMHVDGGGECFWFVFILADDCLCSLSFLFFILVSVLFLFLAEWTGRGALTNPVLDGSTPIIHARRLRCLMHKQHPQERLVACVAKGNRFRQTVGAANRTSSRYLEPLFGKTVPTDRPSKRIWLIYLHAHVLLFLVAVSRLVSFLSVSTTTNPLLLCLQALFIRRCHT